MGPKGLTLDEAGVALFLERQANDEALRRERELRRIEEAEVWVRVRVRDKKGSRRRRPLFFVTEQQRGHSYPQP